MNETGPVRRAERGEHPSSGFGSGRGRLGTKPVGPAAISTRHGVTTVTGPLPVEAVDRIVRQMYGHFRFCYDKALAKNPALEGRLSLRITSLRITIDKNGAAKAVDGGSDIGDPELVSCALKTFGKPVVPEDRGGDGRDLSPRLVAGRWRGPGRERQRGRTGRLGPPAKK